MKSIFSIDVEDWFHILDVPSTPPLSAWDSLPSHVEEGFERLLGLLAESNAKATCFFLGYVAERFPHLVRRAQSAGHEIASHGYAHRLVYDLTQAEFVADAARAKKILEDITGERVLGYRSSGFSVTERTPWYFEALAESGHTYDSSVFPAPRGHGGLKTSVFHPHLVPAGAATLHEFPITVTRVLGRPMCFFGGGYLRLAPYPLIQRMAHRVLDEGRPVVFYVHPREVLPDHPRLPMSRARRFKSYVNLGSTAPKIRSILQDFEVTTFRAFLDQSPSAAVAANERVAAPKTVAAS